MRVGTLLTACLLSAGVLVGCSSDESITPPTPGASDAGRTAQATELISRLQSALRGGDGAAAGAEGVGEARSTLDAAATNVAALGVEPLSLRFVEERVAQPADLTSYGPDAWRGVVEITFALRGWDRADARVETPFVFVPGVDGIRIAAIGGPDGRTPLWLRGRVSDVQVGRARVLSRTPALGRYRALVERALQDVALVLPDWRGRLVLEVPQTEVELDEALDATQQQYANIAAVTAAVDGSLEPDAPVHVFLNPLVFDTLGPRGSQVVISHETTHVATGATFSAMPIWLLEGFADYVALAHADIPVRTAASQILSRVRRQGPPDGLPTPEELSPTASGLGATYEEAWLANRFLARRYGEPALVAFYEAVDGGTPVDEAFRTVVGTTQAAFVKAWSADVDTLAGGEPG